MKIADYGISPHFKLNTGLQFHVEVKPYPEANRIIPGQLEDQKVRFILCSKVTLRGRLSGLQITLLENLLSQNQLLIDRVNQLPGS